ncbi:unnamed protein product [Ixodes pacificus]
MALIRSPFTDLTSSFENYEAVKRCRDFNMQLSLCKEAYGLHRSEKLCRDEYEDFRECIFGFKQARTEGFFTGTLRSIRAQLIQEERKKLYKSGELKDQYAEAPPLDSLNNRTNPV